MGSPEEKEDEELSMVNELTSLPYSPGDEVAVFSASQNLWFEDGVVEEVARKERNGSKCIFWNPANGNLIPKGSVLVAFNFNGVECQLKKWIVPNTNNSSDLKARTNDIKIIDGYIQPPAQP